MSIAQYYMYNVSYVLSLYITSSLIFELLFINNNIISIINSSLFVCVEQYREYSFHFSLLSKTYFFDSQRQ